MSEIKLVHYRNGVFQGEIKSNKRQGKGILITDEGQMVVGTWKNDKLSGEVLMFLNPLQYSFGEFNRGQLQGWSKFSSQDKILISQFNTSKPINRQLLIDRNQNSLKITTLLPSSIYECLKQSELQQFRIDDIQQIIQRQLGVKYPAHANFTLTEYLKEYYKKDQFYETEVLPNGYLMFKIRDQASVISLGFVINKNDQLVSYGSYLNSKLHGLGCKFQNTVRYEGIFQNGFLNGDGLKCASGKYSYGTFQNGTLTNPIYFEQRSLASEQRLRELKKHIHLTNLSFANIYLPQNLFKFRGTVEIIFQLPLRQDFAVSKISATSTKKSMNLASKLVMSREQSQIKSVISKAKTMRIAHNGDQSRISQAPKSVSIANSQRRYKHN